MAIKSLPLAPEHRFLVRRQDGQPVFIPLKGDVQVARYFLLEILEHQVYSRDERKLVTKDVTGTIYKVTEDNKIPTHENLTADSVDEMLEKVKELLTEHPS